MSPAYRVEIAPRARREIKALPQAVQSRVLSRMLALANNARPPGSKKVAGAPPRWRIRVGDYRVVYEIRDDILLILVVRVAHRREVYR